MATSTVAGSGNTFMLYDSSANFNGHSEITVVAWIKSNSTNTDRGFLYTKDDTPGDGDEGICCRYDSSGATWGGTNKLKMAIETTSGNQQLESSDNTQTTNFQNVIFSWAAGGQIDLWLDGVLDPLTTGGRNPARTGTSADTSAAVMHRGFSDSNNCWNGTVYEIRIYNRKLSENEVFSINTMRGSDGIRDGLIFQWHADAGAPGTAATAVIDRSGNGNDGVNQGTVTYAEDEVHTRKRRAA
jgi:hypothetical protein